MSHPFIPGVEMWPGMHLCKQCGQGLGSQVHDREVSVSNTKLALGLREDAADKLREAAVRYTSEAAEFGIKDGDAFAQLASMAREYSDAVWKLNLARAADELKYIASKA
jgi:hypothetical protein